MKNLLIVLTCLLCFNAYASEAPSSVVLQARHGQPNDNYSDATYSFYYSSQDINVNHNDIDIEFSSNKIHSNTVVDDISVMADLGKISCKDIPNDYENQGKGYPTKEDRYKQPMGWFVYSKGMDALQRNPLTELTVEEGHCYAIAKTTNDRKVVAVFHVKKLIPDTSLTINEIEVFNRSKITPIN